MYRIAVPDESSGRPERMYCNRTDSPASSRQPFTYPAAPGVINVLPLGSLSLKSWTIS
jgi:hypothetical protein